MKGTSTPAVEVMVREKITSHTLNEIKLLLLFLCSVKLLKASPNGKRFWYYQVTICQVFLSFKSLITNMYDDKHTFSIHINNNVGT